MSIIQSLSAASYTNAADYALERERIFKTQWWLLGPAHSVAEKGAYISDTVCGWPVIAIRGTDGELRAFHNICRHRGSTLLDEGTGRCRTIVCPYHAWGYSTDGQLKATPRFGDSPDFQPNDYGLLPVRVASFRGMVFISLDDSGPNFDDWIATLDQLMTPFPGLEEMTYHGCFTVEGNANWKTYCDNTVEGYHLDAVHPRLSSAVATGSVTIKPYDDGELVAFHVDYGGDGATLRGNLGLWAYRFPGFQIAISANAFKIERVEPTGIASLRSTNWAWYQNLDAAAIQDSFDWSETVVREDIGICEKVQRNLANGIYDSGPLSPDQESNVALFQRVVRSKLNG